MDLIIWCAKRVLLKIIAGITVFLSVVTEVSFCIISVMYAGEIVYAIATFQ